MTGGGAHISYNRLTGIFVIAHAGKYVVSHRWHVSNLSGGNHTQIRLVMNGQIVASSDIVLDQPNAAHFLFTDIVQVMRPNSEIYLFNNGADISLHGSAATASAISFWGLV